MTAIIVDDGARPTPADVATKLDLGPAAGVTQPPPPVEPEPPKKRVRKSRAKTPGGTTPDKPPAAPRAPGRPPRANLEKRLADQVTMLGVAVCVVNMDDGTAVISGAAQLAKALDHVAAENPKVLAALESFLTASAWSEVAFAVAAIALPIAANHNLVPQGLAGMMGTFTPSADDAE